MTVNVTKMMTLDIDGHSEDSVEVLLFNGNGESKKERATFVEIKMNRGQDRNIEIEWE